MGTNAIMELLKNKRRGTVDVFFFTVFFWIPRGILVNLDFTET